MNTIVRGRNPWITPRQASQVLGVSEMLVYKWTITGRFRALVEPDDTVRLSREDVEKVAAERAESDPVPAPA